MSSATIEDSNGHRGDEVDLHPTAATGVGEGEVDKNAKPKPVFFSPQARAKFVGAAKRAGLSQLEAAELAAELLDRVTQDETPETPAQRRARLANKVGSK